MNMNDLALLLTEEEGGAVDLSIAQVKEVLKLISIACAKDPEVISILIKNGVKHK